MRSTLLALTIFDLSIFVVLKQPPSPYWHLQSEFEAVFSRMLRTYVSSTIAFAFSFFLSSYILQKIKAKTKGRSLFKRIFNSLLISELSGTTLFIFLAFYGVWPIDAMLKFLLLSYFSKVTYELIVYKIITAPLIKFIKQQEKLDIVDNKTDFNPFAWNVSYNESDNIYESTNN